MKVGQRVRPKGEVQLHDRSGRMVGPVLSAETVLQVMELDGLLVAVTDDFWRGWCRLDEVT